MEDNRLKILLIEDNPGDARLIRESLSEARSKVDPGLNIELNHVQSLEIGLAYLSEMPFNVVLLDLSLPDSQGIDTFLTVQESKPEVPVVILSGLNDTETAVQTMQHGAQDYLIKGHFEPNTLINSLRYAIERKQLWLELEQKTKALAESEANLRLMIDKNADGIVIVDKEGITRFVNPAAEIIFARSRQELLGRPFELPLVAAERSELDLPRGDGKTAVVEMRLVEMNWEGQEVYLASLRDITEHQEAKKELARKAAELEKANSDLDAFAHTTAHQIQGLLGQIIGYASYLEMHHSQNWEEEGQQILKRILRSGSKMSNVLSELLLLSTVGKDDIPLIPLNMERIVSEAQKRLAYQIEESQGKISHPGHWPTVLGQSSWIEEVWVNYMSNGLKYGGYPPHLELGVAEEANGMIRFWVKDNGQGIAPADQIKLFKPHTRLRQLQVKGEGLGLSIVRRIIEKCGGQVGVESEIGKGSTFWFTLPAANDDAMPA